MGNSRCRIEALQAESSFDRTSLPKKGSVVAATYDCHGGERFDWHISGTLLTATHHIYGGTVGGADDAQHLRRQSRGFGECVDVAE